MAKTTKARKKAGLKLGLKATLERVVPHEWTIAIYDEKLPAVLSTPAMIGMMETAAALAVKPRLGEGAISVGTRIEVDHLKAAPEGAKVKALARLVKIDGRFLVFHVEARSGRHMLGSGRVFRAVVTPGIFMEKAKRRSRKKAGKRSRGRKRK